MQVDTFLHHLLTSPDYSQQVVHTERIARCSASGGRLDKPLHTALQAHLKDLGISSLYFHQAGAVNAALSGKNVMVATASASGKTLCYNLPVLQTLLEDPSSRALYLFPTKALAQDQLRSLKELGSPDIISLADCATFDGDTPRTERAGIKRQAKIVLTNPDMLHVGILPNHKSWSRLLRNLKYVVIDEAHIYRGVFGSHVANVVRRLRRLCAAYGANPRFICCSATIANPKEHAENLVSLPFDIVSDDGSPHGGKSFVFWNPPLIDETGMARRSSNSEATFLFAELVRNHIRTLVFTRTRRLTELIYLYTRGQLGDTLGELIKPYRAGYLPEDRRQIERELFSGQLLGVVATTALELGIDIGDLEATMLVGYPGSIASTWQQAGRSGRGINDSLSILIAQNNPLDQYFMNHPESFFGRDFENALINPQNINILKPHLLCAAWEQPLTEADALVFGVAFGGAASELEAEGKLRKSGRRWYLSPRISHPAQDISIRSSSGKNYAIVDASQGNQLMETVEESVAYFQIHPGAIYLHQGDSYLVKELDIENRIAVVTPTHVPYYTQTKEIIDIRILKQEIERDCLGINIYLGQVDVTNNVVGFKKKMQFTEEVIGDEPLDLPPLRFVTQSLWFDIPGPATENLAKARCDFAGGLHAVEHAAIAMLPLFALCDRNDIGGVSTPFHPDTGKAQIFIYDAYPGGIGIAAKGFEMMEHLWAATLEAIEECPCQDGCPSCIQSPKCGNNNEPLDKKGAVILLRGLLGIKWPSGSR
jgi:DEAD/DEAH box helicase domain-containing protein